MAAGYNGVTLFFVLSGFVLGWTYVNRLATPSCRGVWDFGVARVARIYPLYLAALVFAVIPNLTKLPAWTWKHVFSVQAWSSNLSVAFGLNGPGWSIGVEFFLYALFPLALWALAKARPSALVVTALTAILVLTAITALFYAGGLHLLPHDDPSSAHRWLYRTPLMRLPDFVVGVCLGLLAQRGILLPGSRVVQLLSVAAILVMMSSQRLLFSAVSWDLAYLVPSAALIWSLASAPGTLLARFLAARPVVYGGTISFALYLFHVPVIYYIGMDADSLGAWARSVLIVVSAAMLIAAGAHHAIEVPAHRWMRATLSRAVPQSSAKPARQPGESTVGRLD